MKPTHLVLLFLVATVLSHGVSVAAVDQSQTINAVIGDVSFIEKYGRQPGLRTDETLRIQTHLEYVEKILRQRDCGLLSPELRERRKAMLDLLDVYWTAGLFPRNFDYEGRRIPCFIDREGRICAVGYLIEQTTGRDVAEEINTQYKYAKILEMRSKTVDRWIAWSGLTAEECAMIQPAYGYQNVTTCDHIEPWYGVSTSLLSAGSISLSTINAVQMIQGERKKTLPIVGIVVGASQTILGIVVFPAENTYNGYTTNESEKVLSLINIGLGTTTMILSIWNLTTIPELEKIGWNIYPLYAPNGEMGLALNLSARL